MTRAEAQEEIAVGFAVAEAARKIGNDGKVRVCARRAAGAAIRYWLTRHPRKNYGRDAMNQLRAVIRDQSAPQEVRSAARRLATKVTDRFLPVGNSDPLEDSKIIINHFLES
jgi:hypothetical protein